MKKDLSFAAVVFLALLIAVSLAGCSSGGDDDGIPPVPPRFSTADLAGDWHLTTVNLLPSADGKSFYGLMQLTSSGNLSHGYYIGFPGLPSPLNFTTGNLTITESGIPGGSFSTSTFTFRLENGKMDESKQAMLFNDHTESLAIQEKDFVVAIRDGGAFIGPDIHGDWFFFGFCSDRSAILATGSIHGQMNISNVGFPTGSYTQAGVNYDITGGSIAIDASGVINPGNTFLLGPPYSGTKTIFFGKLDPSKTFASFVSGDAAESDLIVMIKQAALLSTADLQGTWHIFGASAGGLQNGTISGSMEVGPAGQVTGGTLTLPGEVQRNITGGTLGVTGAGSVTGTIHTSFDDIIIQAGRLDATKKKMAFTDVTNVRLFVLLK